MKIRSIVSARAICLAILPAAVMPVGSAVAADAPRTPGHLPALVRDFHTNQDRIDWAARTAHTNQDEEAPPPGQAPVILPPPGIGPGRELEPPPPIASDPQLAGVGGPFVLDALMGVVALPGAPAASVRMGAVPAPPGLVLLLAGLGAARRRRRRRPSAPG